MDTELMHKLRGQTHCGLLDCKRAWISVGYDYDKAVEYLRTIGTIAHVNPVFTRLDALEAVVFCDETQRTLSDVLEVSELKTKIRDLEAQRDRLWADRKELRDTRIGLRKEIDQQADVIKELETGLKEVEVLRKTAFTQDKLIDRQAERITHYIDRVDELEVSNCTNDEYVASCTNLIESQKVVAELREEVKELETQRFTNAKKLNLQAYQINELNAEAGRSGQK